MELAASIATTSLTVTCVEFAILLAFNKVLTSMWIFILTLQFLLYIAIWKINLPEITRIVLFELRKVALGEFFDNIPIGDELAKFFNIPSKEDSSTEQKMDETRVGSADIFASFGPTLVLVSAILAGLVILVICSVYLSRRLGCSQKCKSCFTRIQDKIFWNSFIRYILMNALKLLMASIVVFKLGVKKDQQLAVAIAILTALTLAFMLFYCMLKKYQSSLGAETTKKRMSTLYVGRNVNYEKHGSHRFPVAFFLRRLVFTVVTVYLLDYPAMQMIFQQLLTMAAIVHLAYDTRALSSSMQKIVEMGSEILLLLACTLLAQFNAFGPDDKKKRFAIEICFLVVLALLALLNLVALIKEIVLAW
eukprot:CAMPEP_0185571574 /NCGR_PEP_ID=MMETSP0434-20130131/3613_1 /TAXON_ID=626734 ORGANISM="Favella taraikaensis, Strain Fe Narragansett Bay" /NCGR_SAMPLE_ID=MMETSP0434 /ASSEMBLY_ACC=CAM_ASM_000379 /LENGTH=362 /DNA_ID=CAMNT_0028187075 /DNA_START=218 /DNA_END=1303 /DNA_ORIENTATION=+